MITLCQFAVSPYCDKIRRVLRYKKIPFTIYDIGKAVLRQRPGLTRYFERVDTLTQADRA